MLYLHKKLEEITEEDIKRLKVIGAMEDLYIDYKEFFHIDKPKERKELLADICAFANARGGDIIFGIKAKGGLPIDFPGVEIPRDQIDEIKLTLNNILYSSIEERIPGLESRFIPIENDRYFLVIRISESYQAPHMVRFDKSTNFVIRHDNKKDPMTISEIRDSFLKSSGYLKEIELFIQSRVNYILSTESHEPMFLFHAVPFKREDSFRDISSNQFLESMYGFGRNSLLWEGSHSFRLEGYENYDDSGGKKSYVLLFRDGCIEGFKKISPKERNIIAIPEIKVVKFFREIIDLAKEDGIPRPFVFTLTLLDFKGYSFSNDLRENPECIKLEVVRLPIVTIYDLSNVKDSTVQPILDTLANAAGNRYCLHFDNDGNFKLDY